MAIITLNAAAIEASKTTNSFEAPGRQEKSSAVCCRITTFLLLSPRVVQLILWRSNSNRFDRAFDSFFRPALGVVSAPFTTLIHVVVFPGSVEGFDWFLIVLAALADLSSYAGDGYGNRGRVTAHAR